MKCHICNTDNSAHDCEHYTQHAQTRTNYYFEQLGKVKPGATQYAPTFKIFANGNGTDTKHINLNHDSAQILINWLKIHYINK